MNFLLNVRFIFCCKRSKENLNKNLKTCEFTNYAKKIKLNRNVIELNMKGMS